MDNTKMVLRSRLNLGFNLNYFSFYCKFYAFKIFFFTMHVFNFFIRKIIK